jgi:adenine-specific DNA-methyltransferase
MGEGEHKVFVTPKPVSLLDRIISIATDEKSIVLDSFAGSGTTAHAVLAANKRDQGERRFVLVESETYADGLTAERIRRVIKGYEFEGTQSEELYRESLTFTTLKKADKLLQHVASIENLEGHRFDAVRKEVSEGVLVVTGEQKVKKKTEGLGGAFTYCTLGEPLDMDKLLTGERMPKYEALGAWLFHTATGEALKPKAVDQSKWFLGESAGFFVWLVYKPDLDFLKSRDAALTLELAESIAKAKDARGINKRHLVFSPAKYVPNKMLLPLGVEHAPLPFALYRLEKS